MPGKNRDKIVKIDTIHKIIMDGVDIAKRADSHGVILVDLEPAKAFIEKYRQEKRELPSLMIF